MFDGTVKTANWQKWKQNYIALVGSLHMGLKVVQTWFKNLVSGTPVVDWNSVFKGYPHLKDAIIPKPEDNNRVQILLGTDYSHLYGTLRGLIGKDFEPIVELTKLGRVKSDQILASWISQYGLLKSHFMLFCMTKENSIEPWRKQPVKLPRIFELPETGLTTIQPATISSKAGHANDEWPP